MRPLLKNAIKIVRKASNQLVRSYDQLSDPVPYASRLSLAERVQNELFNEMQEAIAAIYPKHDVVLADGMVRESEYVWYVMPIDGIEHFCRHGSNFSVGLCLYHHQKPAVSVIMDCLHDDIYTAIKGEGAQLNGHKIRLTANTKLQQCAVLLPMTTGQEYISTLPVLQQHAESVSSGKQSLLGMAFLASGQVDFLCAFQPSLPIFQMTMLHLKEGGAFACDLTGADYSLESSSALVGTPKCAREFLSLIINNSQV